MCFQAANFFVQSTDALINLQTCFSQVRLYLGFFGRSDLATLYHPPHRSIFYLFVNVFSRFVVTGKCEGTESTRMNGVRILVLDEGGELLCATDRNPKLNLCACACSRFLMARSARRTFSRYEVQHRVQFVFQGSLLKCKKKIFFGQGKKTIPVSHTPD